MWRCDWLSVSASPDPGGDSKVVTWRVPVPRFFCVNDTPAAAFYFCLIIPLQWPLTGTSSNWFFTPQRCLVEKSSWVWGGESQGVSWGASLVLQLAAERRRERQYWSAADGGLAACAAEQEVGHWEGRKWLLWSYANPLFFLLSFFLWHGICPEAPTSGINSLSVGSVESEPSDGTDADDNKSVFEREQDVSFFLVFIISVSCAVYVELHTEH